MEQKKKIKRSLENGYKRKVILAFIYCVIVQSIGKKAVNFNLFGRQQMVECIATQIFGVNY